MTSRLFYWALTSALAGFLIMLAAFFMGGWLGRHLDGTVFALTHGIWFWSTCIALTAWTAPLELDDMPAKLGPYDVAELARKGRDLEVTVLARAMREDLEHRVLPFGNRTVVFH